MNTPSYEIPAIRRYHEPYDTRPGQTTNCDHGEPHECLVTMERKARLKGIEFLTYHLFAEPLREDQDSAAIDSAGGGDYVFEKDWMNNNGSYPFILTTRETLRTDLLAIVPATHRNLKRVNANSEYSEGSDEQKFIVKIMEIWDFMPHGKSSGDEYDHGDWRYRVTVLEDGKYEFEFMESSDGRLPLFEEERFTVALE